MKLFQNQRLRRYYTQKESSTAPHDTVTLAGRRWVRARHSDAIPEGQRRRSPAHERIEHRFDLSAMTRGYDRWPHSDSPACLSRFPRAERMEGGWHQSPRTNTANARGYGLSSSQLERFNRVGQSS